VPSPKQIWKLAAREDDAPKATDARRGWHEILPAAALQGAVYAMVKAAVGRGAAASTHRLTGVLRRLMAVASACCFRGRGGWPC
jgi:hypothetical protein